MYIIGGEDEISFQSEHYRVRNYIKMVVWLVSSPREGRRQGETQIEEERDAHAHTGGKQ